MRSATSLTATLLQRWRIVVFALCAVAAVPAIAASDNTKQHEWKTEWTVQAGGGAAVPVFNSKANRWMETITGSWGRIITPVRGRGPFAGRLQFLVEAVPLFVVFQSQPAYGVGITPIAFRWNFETERRWQPFAELAGGIVRTDRQVPEGTKRFNFTAQAGIGVRVHVSRGHAVLLGYRFHHLSNGQRAESNPGVNSNLFYAGISFLR